MDKMKLLPFKEMRDDQCLPLQQQPVVNPYLRGLTASTVPNSICPSTEAEMLPEEDLRSKSEIIKLLLPTGRSQPVSSYSRRL